MKYLKPCKKCDMVPTFIEDKVGHYIKCSKCQDKTSYYKTQDESSLAWNSQHGSDNNEQIKRNSRTIS